MNFTAGVVGGFYQFNTMGDAQVSQCASNRSHTYPTVSLQNPARAASKGQLMDHKGNVNAARCSVGPITRQSGQDHLLLPENVTLILMHILYHHHALEEGWLGTHLGSVYFSLFSGKDPVVSAAMQAARHGSSVRLWGCILRAWLLWLVPSMWLGFLAEFNGPHVSYYDFFSNLHFPQCLCYRILLSCSRNDKPSTWTSKDVLIKLNPL